MRTFQYNDYEGLCAAMAMIDAATSNLDGNNANERNEWSTELHRMRNEMNGERLALLAAHGECVYHVEDIPAARTEGGDK